MKLRSGPATYLLPTPATAIVLDITKLKLAAIIAKMPHAVYDTDPEDARHVNVPPVDHEVEEWNIKLKGKKLGEKTDDTVRLAPWPLQCCH